MYEFKEGIERSQVPDVCGFIKQNWAVFLLLGISVQHVPHVCILLTPFLKAKNGFQGAFFINIVLMYG